MHRAEAHNVTTPRGFEVTHVDAIARCLAQTAPDRGLPYEGNSRHYA